MKTFYSKVTFDIECNGLNPDKIWCIVIKEYKGDTHIFRHDNDNIQEGIDMLMQSETLIGHNIIGFDIPVLNKLYDIDLFKDKEIIDTLTMSRLFNPIREGGHGLESWGYRLKIYKADPPDEWDKFDPRMIPYCEQDVVLNEALYDKLVLDGGGFSDQSIEVEHEVSKILQRQEQHGFFFNEKKGAELLAILKTRMREVEDEVHKVFKPRWVDVKLVTPKLKKDGTLSKSGLTKYEYDEIKNSTDFTTPTDMKPFMRKKLQEFNLGSRKQIGEYLTDFGWKPRRFTPTGQPIIDEGTLKKIDHIPEAKLIAEFLLLQKRIAQIDSWFDVVEDSRVHGRVFSIGAITNRMSHRSPNLAQVPSLKSEYGKECRACWSVPEGYKLVGIDAAGLELRMLAHYMRDDEYTNELINGDIHSRNQEIAGLKTRDNAKSFIYALMYGAGDAKLGEVVGGSKATGKKLKQQFLNNLPSFKILKSKVEQASQRGYLLGLDGRRIFVRHEHASLNTLLQSAGAIVMKIALVMLDTLAKEEKLDYHFVANVHDEWQVEVLDKDAERFGELGVKAIQEAGKYLELRCPLDGEYKIGDSWDATH